MKLYITDAFTDEIFGGNPAGVVMVEGGEYPPFDIMLKTAAELRYSETVFVKPKGEDSWELRYFTPTDEVDLCGHATIAAFNQIGKEFGQEKTYKAITKAGEISVDVSSDLIMMEMGVPEIIQEIENEMIWEATRKILGLKPEDSYGTGGFEGIFPSIVSTGLPDIVVPVDSLEELNAITPDFEAMSKLSERQKVVGIHAYVLRRAGSDLKIDCRNFAPLYGINEEAATGTANGALTYYLYKKGIIRENELNTITQGESMGRPSKIVTMAEIDNDGKVIIKVGGSAATVAEGEIFI